MNQCMSNTSSRLHRVGRLPARCKSGARLTTVNSKTKRRKSRKNCAQHPLRERYSFSTLMQINRGRGGRNLCALGQDNGTVQSSDPSSASPCPWKTHGTWLGYHYQGRGTAQEKLDVMEERGIKVARGPAHMGTALYSVL